SFFCAFLRLNNILDVQEITTGGSHASESSEALPFPFQRNSFCRYESIEKTIERERVLVVDNLLRDENDLSEIAIAELGKHAKSQLKIERHIATLALQNIVTNIARLVKEPVTKIAHISELPAAVDDFKPDAIVLSGT